MQSFEVLHINVVLLPFWIPDLIDNPDLMIHLVGICL